MGLPGGSDGKGSAGNTRNPGSTSGWGRPSKEGNGSPLQYSCLENSVTEDPGDYSPWGHKGPDTTEWQALNLWDYPGDPVVKMPYFHLRGCRLNPCSRN